uniref:Globoside alpha-1,3-N-acetylgalactosaminyltransferase 1-like n=1 Tax=Oryzias latipes TaxID=8090 RepID=A0A3P9K558_ORYLA
MISEAWMSQNLPDLKIHPISDLLNQNGFLDLRATNGSEITFQGWVEVCLSLCGPKKQSTNSNEVLVPVLVSKDIVQRPIIGRTDVNCVTNWNVPLVWEGTFDPIVIDAIYKKTNPRVGVMIFTVGKYTRFLKGFLETGEKHFLTDFRVTYYIFTDNEKEVPAVALNEGRKITVLPVPSAKRWQEVVFGRMKWATITIDKQIRNEADYLFLMDVDSLFHNRIGAESFSRLYAVLHRGYYKNTERANFPYERHPESRAYIPVGEGDYYYTAAVLGGYLEDIYKLSEEDARNNIEAVWQEESHLRITVPSIQQPTKVLSPEYLWSDYDAVPADIKVVRISQLKKNYAEVRPNGGH